MTDHNTNPRSVWKAPSRSRTSLARWAFLLLVIVAVGGEMFWTSRGQHEPSTQQPDAATSPAQPSLEASAAKEVPTARKAYGPDGAWVLGCMDIQTYRLHAPNYTASHRPEVIRAINKGVCIDLNDRASLVEEHFYHVQKRDGEFVCVLPASKDVNFHNGCFWTLRSNLQHIGQPALSDAQFGRVTELYAQQSNLEETALQYETKAFAAAKEARIAVDPASRKRLQEEADRLQSTAKDYRARAEKVGRDILNAGGSQR